MSLSTYTIFRIISGFFGIFYIERFLGTFIHNENKRRNKLYVLLYLVYPLLTILSILIGNIPIVNFLVNLSSLYIMSLRYKCSIGRRIMSVGMIFFIMLITDIVCAITDNTLNVSLISETQYKNITSIVIYNLVIYMFSVLLKNIKTTKKEAKLPIYIWFCFIGIPLVSVISIFITVQIETMKTFQISALFIILLSINVMSFFIYDSIIETYEEKIISIALKEEKEYYQKQCIYMQETEKEFADFRHDIANQISLLKEMSIIRNNKIDESVKYLEDKLQSATMFSSTQNLVVDSILNMKYTEIRKYDISVECKCLVPCKMDIEPMDLMVIIGNILDNSIRAAKDSQNEKYINIHIVFENGMLYIDIKNSYSGKLLIEDGKFLTTKSNKTLHGLGLQNIKRTVRKYHGKAKFSYTDKEFSSEIILYLR